MLFSLLLVALAMPPAQETTAPTFDEAVEAANAGRDQEALVSFQRLASINPADHQARLWIARLHDRMGHPERAEPVYRSILLEDPRNVDAMVGVAGSLLWRQEPEDAIDILTSAEELSPENDVVLVLLADAHQQAGRTARALTYRERAVAIAPTAQHRFSLERARLSSLHRIETRGFTEQFNGSTPDGQGGDVMLNLRLTETVRAAGRAQMQRRFGISEKRAGGGLEWRWKPAVWLRGQALIGIDNRIMPEGDYLGEIEYTRGPATWAADVRYVDFTGARTTFFSPKVTWWESERLSVTLLYAISWTETNAQRSTVKGHSGHIRGTYRLFPRISVHASYAAGVEDFDTFAIDRIGDFRANTAAGGVQLTLPTLTSVNGVYEHQTRRGGINMNRVTVFLAQRF